MKKDTKACMQKLPKSGEWEKDIYDNIITPSLPKASNIHPNTISLAGLGVSALSIKMTSEKKYFAGASLGLLRTYFDWLDGPVARCTDRVSVLGDYIDHLSDWSFYIATSYVLFTHLETANEKGIYLGLLGAIAVLVFSYFGCSEKFYNSGAGTLQWTQNMCKDEQHMYTLNHMNVTDLWILLYFFATMIYLHTK